MWPRPRLVDLITAHLDTPLIPSGPGALCNSGLSDEEKVWKESKERTEKDTKIKKIKTDLESNGAVGGMCVFWLVGFEIFGILHYGIESGWTLPVVQR